MCPHRAHSQRSIHLRRQHGAALLIMLVILIVGAMGFLVSELSKASLQTSRNNKSSDLLAQAKEVVIGYAVSGGSRPGDLPYQDRLVTPTESGGSPNYDGNQDLCPGLTGCLGRLAWRTLGMSIDSPSENDPSGFMPWYAVSANMVDPTFVTFNSELLNTAPHPWLTVRDMNGNILSNRVAFVIIIPGRPINGQSRPSSPSLGGAVQYLDSISLPAGCSPTPPAPACAITYSNADLDDSFIMGDEHRWIDDPINPGKKIEDSTYHFNDKLIYVTIDELMPLIEKRVAREVKTCLDDYAANSSNKYPWAAPVSDTTNYTGAINTLFGRVPAGPNINTTLGASSFETNLTNSLGTLQASLNTFAADTNSKSAQITLNTAGTTLEKLANSIANAQPTSPAIASSVTTPAISAGSFAKNIPKGASAAAITSLQSKINSAYAVLPSGPTLDSSMSSSWPPSCSTLFDPNGYWPIWQNLVFYQTSSACQPGSTTCTTAATLTINGSGNANGGNGTYRAAVIIAGKMKAGQTSRTPTNVSDYLELSNQANKTIAMPTTLLETYKLTDPSYPTVNDLVLCLDGKNNCK